MRAWALIAVARDGRTAVATILLCYAANHAAAAGLDTPSHQDEGDNQMAGSAILDRLHRDVASSGVQAVFRTFYFLGLFAGFSLTSAYAQAPSQPMVYEGVIGGPKLIEEGQPPVWIHSTVEDAERLGHGNARRGSPGAASSLSDLSYRGGIGGTGVETLPKVYLVLWGSQWNNNDPSGEASILEDFYNGVGASSWLNSVTQYCQGVATGAIFCNGAGQAAGNPAAIFSGVWSDSASAAPTHPRQSQLASEAVRAAAHFGNNTASSNVSTQYVIATATKNSSNGFGVQYCAWHSATNSSYGKIAYTNLPYITDAGTSCGANFNGLGPEAGITIVGGHELAETITDQFPNTGWLDSGGAENGDKCAWISSGQGAAANVLLNNGHTFAVQSLWSNEFNGGGGGCVISYP